MKLLFNNESLREGFKNDPEGEPMAGGSPQRFHIDHSVIHDRKTGQHVAMQAEPDWQERLLNLLRELDSAAPQGWQQGAAGLREAVQAGIERYRKTDQQHSMDNCSLEDAIIEAILSRHSAPTSAPEGFVMVPREPTEDMLEDACKAKSDAQEKYIKEHEAIRSQMPHIQWKHPVEASACCCWDKEYYAALLDTAEKGK